MVKIKTMPKLLLDEMLSDYNKNKPSGKEALDRNSFGQLIWTDRNESNYKTTLSKWASNSNDAVPSLMMSKKICKILGIDFNTYIKKYVK